MCPNCNILDIKIFDKQKINQSLEISVGYEDVMINKDSGSSRMSELVSSKQNKKLIIQKIDWLS